MASDPPPSSARLALVHACFAELCAAPGTPRTAGYPPDVLAEAEEMLRLHRLLEETMGPPPELADAPPRTSHATSGTLAAGTAVGPFVLEECLGSGASGEVYRARQEAPARVVALKVLWGVMSDGAGAREAATLAGLEHPSIARLYQTGEFHDGRHARAYLAMEFIQGGHTLAAWSASTHDDAARVRMVVAIADAVAFAHGRGVIHRDLKPQNILVSPDGRPVLIDFGIARLARADPARTLSMLGLRVSGTLAYAAPESLDPQSSPDVRGDIFALGAILYELLAQRPFRSFQARDLPGMIAETLRADTPPLSAVAPRFRGDLERIVLKAAAREPALRYATASQFADDLNRHLAGEPVLAELQSPRERLQRALWRHRRSVVAGGLVAALLVATTSVSLAFARSARHEARIANLSVAARAIDAGDLMLVAQHASALGDDDGSIERAVIERALSLRGATIAEGDWYSIAHAGDNAILAVGYPPGTVGEPVLARFERDGAQLPWRPIWSVPAVHTATNCIALTEDCTRVAMIDDEGRLAVLDAHTGLRRGAATDAEPEPRGCAVAVSRTGAIATGRDRVELRDVDMPERVLAEIDPAIGTVRALAFSSDDPSLLAVAGHAGAVLLAWRDGRLAEAVRFETPDAIQVALRWSPDGRRIAIGGWDRTIRLYEPSRPAPLWTARGHHDAVWSIVFDGRSTTATRVLSAGSDGTLRVWRADDGSLIAALPHSNDLIWALSAMADGSLVTASQGGLTIAPAETRDAWIGSGPLEPLSRTGGALRIEPGPQPRMVERATGRLRTLPPLPGEGAVSRVAIAADDGTALLLREDGTISLVDLVRSTVRWSTDSLRAEDVHEPQGISSLALDAVGSVAVVASRAFGCVVLDARDGTERWRRPVGASCTDVAVSPDGTRIFAADRDGVMEALDARDGRLLASARRQRTRASCMAVTPDGSRLVTGGADGTLRILDAATLEEQMMLLISQEQLRSLWIEDNGVHAIDRSGVLRTR